VELNEYQRQASETDQRPGKSPASLLIPLLGLAGEAGTLLSEYKKQLRDGPGHVRFADRVREELGDILWYLGNVADKMGLDLDDVAHANLGKVTDRWKDIAGEPIFFDEQFPEAEQLPREFEVTFAYDADSGKAKVVVNREGQRVGNPLTDNAYEEDGYRFHDVYHFTFAALLGWSPVTRRNLKRKRKSDPMVDEVEDGGRGWVIEEGIAALGFAYAGEHGYFEETDRVDESLLKTVRMLTSTAEVRVRSAREWENAIVTASRIWKLVRDHDGGTIRCNLQTRTVDYVAPTVAPA
jgi:NTP pyrophosphatase (non-canonical NTP hydrolase)